MAKWVDEDGKEVTDSDLINRLDAGEGRPQEESSLYRFGRGMARAGAGFLTEAGEASNAAALQFVDPQGAAEPSSRQARQASGPMRQFANAPTTGWESLGRGVGEVAPFVAQPELGFARGAAATGMRFLPSLARMSEDALWGGVSGGLQPRPNDTLEEHERDFKYGAGGASLSGLARGAVNTIPGSHALNMALAQTLAPFVGHHAFAVYYALTHSGIGRKLASALSGVLRPGIAGPAAANLTEKRADDAAK